MNFVKSDILIVHESKAQVSVNLKNTLEDYSHIALGNLSFPKNYYLVRQDTIIEYKKDLTDYQITIEKGNYSFQSLLAYINNLQSDFIMSYNNTDILPDIQKYLFTFGTCASAQITNIPDIYLAHALGFEPYTTYTATPSAPDCILESVRLIDFQSINMCFIKTNIIESSENYVLSAFIVNNNQYGSYVTYTNPDIQNSLRRINVRGQNNLELQIFDENGEIIQFEGFVTYTLLLFKFIERPIVVVDQFERLINIITKFIEYTMHTDDLRLRKLYDHPD